MNYRHAYHAGNSCDVVKHSLLCLLLRHLRKKETPFCLLDTHAGAGGYNLAAGEPLRTGEAASGIQRLDLSVALKSGDPAADEALADYFGVIGTLRGTLETPHFYPGSPMIAQSLLRPQDRLVLVEKHPEEYAKLRRLFGRQDDRLQFHARDAYEAMLALIPPHERRGLVLIDPPYELRDEFDRAARTLVKAWRRWPTGIYALWYPVKDRAPFWECLDRLIGAKIPLLQLELILRDENSADRLNGTGMLVINPPWQFEAQARALLTALAPLLGEDGVQAKIVAATAA